jgi:hypothetical protein
VAVSNYRREKTLAKYCFRNAIDYYLPLTMHKNRSKAETIPLFHGFLFLALPSGFDFSSLRKDARLESGSPLIINFLRPSPDGYLCHRLRQEIEAIATETTSSRSGRLLLQEIPDIGVPVQITAGPLKGLDGIVEGHKLQDGRIRMFINVVILGRVTSIEIDRSQIELLHSNSTPLEGVEV